MSYVQYTSAKLTEIIETLRCLQAFMQGAATVNNLFTESSEEELKNLRYVIGALEAARKVIDRV